MPNQLINWKSIPADVELVHRIVSRAIKLGKKHGQEVDAMETSMDLIACHLNGNPLDLERLLDLPDFDFSHDVFGIKRHIDRQTGKLMDCFSPRCSLPETAEA